LINNIIKDKTAMTVKEIFTGSPSSSPKVASCRKNTIMLEIQSIVYMMIENIFIGALILSVKLYGNI
jgi:hypothetical protein